MSMARGWMKAAAMAALCSWALNGEVQAQTDAVEEQAAEVVQDQVNEPQQQEKMRRDEVVAAIEKTHALAKQIEQTHLAIQQIGQHLEALEKLENMVIGNDLPSRQQLLFAAEALGKHSQEHLQKVSEILKARAEGLYESKPEMALLLAQMNKKQIDSALLKAEKAAGNSARLESQRLAEKEKLAAMKADKEARLAQALALAEMQKANADSESSAWRKYYLSKVLDVENLAAQLSADHPQAAAVSAGAELQQRMESLESRMMRIEELLKKLVDDK